MEITARLTADAVVRTVKQDKKVVGFTLAINDSYRTDGERRELTTFVECSYWRNEGIAEYLKKGGLVQVYGRIGVNAYLSGNNEPRATITFHVSEIKMFGGASANTPARSQATKEGETATVTDDSMQVDDLPF